MVIDRARRVRIGRRAVPLALIGALIVPAPALAAPSDNSTESPQPETSATDVEPAETETTEPTTSVEPPPESDEPIDATTSTTTGPPVDDEPVDSATTGADEPLPTGEDATGDGADGDDPDGTTDELPPEPPPTEAAAPALSATLAAATIAPPDCTVPVSVRPTSAGSAPLCVETRLTQLGYPVTGPDRYLDPVSLGSLESFATSRNIPWRGVATALVLDELGIWSGPSLDTRCTVSAGVWPTSSGSAPLCLETRLAQLGYDMAGPNRRLDAVSIESLKDFQRQNGLTPTGVAGPTVLRRLGIWANPPLPASACRLSASVRPSNVGTAPQCVEQRLEALGYQVDGPDRRLDSVSLASLRSFSLSKGIPWRGVATALLLYKLGLWSGPPLSSNCKVSAGVWSTSVGSAPLCLETRLAGLGYDVAGPNRRLDAVSIESLKAFQRLNGLTPSGVAGPTVLRRLGIWEDPPPPPPPPPPANALPANSGSGRRIVYQKTYPMRVWLVNADGSVAKTHLVSGRADWNQPRPGTYSVFSRSRYTCNINNPHICWPYMVRFTKGPGGDNIGFHEIPTNLRTGYKLQSISQLGTPLSGGCVRQAPSDALFLWNWAPIGTKVVVLP